MLLYKEVEMALGLNSYHSKMALIGLGGGGGSGGNGAAGGGGGGGTQIENIYVLRHPDHVPGITASTLFWAHHEKVRKHGEAKGKKRIVALEVVDFRAANVPLPLSKWILNRNCPLFRLPLFFSIT